VKKLLAIVLLAVLGAVIFTAVLLLILRFLPLLAALAVALLIAVAAVAVTLAILQFLVGAGGAIYYGLKKRPEVEGRPVTIDEAKRLGEED